MNPVNMTMPGSYDYRLVTLSVTIAIFASYTALDLAGRVTASRGWARVAWLTGGATAMGLGIWSMHYIGMLAFSLPVPVRYYLPTVVLSLVAAIFASAVALYVVSRQKMGILPAAIGSIIMGAGIAGMHYIGMEAMRLSAECMYDLQLVSLSVVLAIVISLVALWLSFSLREEKKGASWRKIASASVMGAAIPVMHYTGMAAASFTPSGVPPDWSHAVSISSLGVAGITIITLMVLGLAVLTSFVDRRFSAQTLELESSEARYRQLFERSLAGVYRITLGGRILDCNEAFSRILGYASREEHLSHAANDRYLGPADREAYSTRIQEQKALTNFERCLRRKDGNAVWVLENATLLDGKDGAPGVIEGTLVDITERKQAEVELKKAKDEAESASLGKEQMLQAIQRSEARLREVIESINEGMCVVGTDGLVDLWNRAAEESLRHTRQDMLGRSLFEAYPGLQDSRLPAALKEASGSGHTIVLEDLQLTLEGINHVFLARVFPFEGGTTIFFSDVGERKRAEKRLAAQHGTTRALAESSTLAEAVPKILDAMCESLGWDLGIFWGMDETLGGLTIFNTWHSHRIPAPVFNEATLVSHLARGEGLPGIVCKKGTLEWVPNILEQLEFLQHRFTAETGLRGALALPVETSKQIIGVIEIMTRDIQGDDKDLLKVIEAIAGQVCQFAERKRAEKVQAATFRAAEAANAASDLADLFRSTHSIVSDLMPAKNLYVGLYNPDTEILSFPYFVDENDPTPPPRELKKGLTEYVLRTGIALLAPPAVVEELKVKGEIENVGAPSVCWLGIPLKKGEDSLGVLTVQSYTEGVVFGEEEQKILTFVAAQMAMAIERKRAEAELKSALQMKSDFVSFATHQLRTPLAGIKWSLELAAQEENLSEDAASFIQDGRESAQRLIGMVNDLLDVSRLESGKLKLAPKETSLAELTRGVLKDVSHQIGKQGHHVSVAGMEEIPPVLVDPQLFRQVILNMVSNAIKYTPSGGNIDIRMGRQDGMVRWAIADNGIGIPKASQARLFEKFYRAENVYKIETEGTGLGLHLVKMIVEKSGGKIWCESEEDKGSTFQFTLPLGGGKV